jgi:hypothetical protein
MQPMVEVVPTQEGKGKVLFHFHPGQERVMASHKRIVLALAGNQSGKTELAPPWLWREMRRKGPGDYLVASPSYPLMDKKLLPAFQRFFHTYLQLGDYKGQSKVFRFTEEGSLRLHGRVCDEPTNIFFGHAQDPDSLESATYKAAVIDEAGQKAFRLGSYEAIMRRLSIHQGRLLIPTTPYDLGWLKQRIYDPWDQARKNGQPHPEIDVINFKSIENPAFPREEYLRAKRDLPPWRFHLFYDAIFTRPAGQIYHCFETALHVIPRRSIPDHWPRHFGLDFGPVNTACVMLAEELNTLHEPTGRLLAYREYHPGEKRTPEQHVLAIMAGDSSRGIPPEPRMPHCVGGSHSEDEWRDDFGGAGLSVFAPPIKEVEVGIDRVFATIQRGELLVMNDLVELLDELESYSREVDEAGNVGEKIDEPNIYHLCDSLRYILADVRPGGGLLDIPLPPREAASVMSHAPASVMGVRGEDWDEDKGTGINWGQFE